MAASDESTLLDVGGDAAGLQPRRCGRGATARSRAILVALLLVCGGVLAAVIALLPPDRTDSDSARAFAPLPGSVNVLAVGDWGRRGLEGQVRGCCARECTALRFVVARIRA